MRKEIKRIEFSSRTDTFGNYYDAQEWLRNNGYSYGSSCCPGGTPICKGEYILPQKWYNLSAQEQRNVDGVIVGDLRDGKVTAILYK